MTGAMNPTGLYGLCAICSRRLEVHTELRTAFFGIPQQAHMVHKACADEHPELVAPTAYSVDMHLKGAPEATEGQE